MSRSQRSFLVTWVTAFCVLARATAFYLPGIAPTDYMPDDVVPVLVNSLASVGGENVTMDLKNIDYYADGLHFCRPDGGPRSHAGSLGGILFGDRIYTSRMELTVLKDETCHFLCSAHYSDQDLELVKRLIMENYYNRWTVDSLPISGQWYVDDAPIFSSGFPVGDLYYESDNPDPVVFLYNHQAFEIEYHRTANGKIRIVGASSWSYSLETKAGEDFNCQVSGGVPLDTTKPRDIAYSYSVKWKESETPWATRWDKYLHVVEPKINWFALINTTALVFFMALFTNLMLLRLLRKDIAKYNVLDLEEEEVPEELGWKMIHGDVFRAPENTMAYSIVIGTGAQILCSVVGTLFLALIGLLSPANRGAFSTVLLTLNSLFSGIGGYTSAAIYKLWGGQSWKTNLLFTPVVVPALVFLLFLSLNFLLIFANASGAVPFGNIAAIVLIWMLISVPLSFICGFMAFKREWPKPPVRVNQIPRQIPRGTWKDSTIFMMLVGGLLPFLSISLQLHYIMSAIWFQKLYYMFGFLFASIIAAILLCVSMTSLMVYFTIGAENYLWQWRAFYVSGSPAIYIFLYSILYMERHMSLGSFVDKLLYSGYSFMAALLSFLALGMVGAVTSHFLMRRIYSSIKIE